LKELEAKIFEGRVRIIAIASLLEWGKIVVFLVIDATTRIMDFVPSPEFSLSGKPPVSGNPDEWTSEAMVHSSFAANFMQEGKFDKAFSSYQQALKLYRGHYLEGSLVDRANAASTLHNMSLIHKRQKRYHQAVSSLQEAETLYRECMAMSTERKAGDEGVCVEYLLTETLQNRANIHFKYQRDISAAVECHEEVVAMLLNLDSAQQIVTATNSGKTFGATQDGGVFVAISDDQKIHLLSVSLRSLGNLYLQQGNLEDALGAFQEALDMLRCRQSKFSDLKLCRRIASILLSMSCVYFVQHELDQAMGALDECIASYDGDETRSEVVTALHNLGIAYERKGDYDKAMKCYDDVLELRRREFGDSHIHVAESLTTVAKMMERQGRVSDALRRYQESLEIYRSALSDQDLVFGSNLAGVLSKISTFSDEKSIEHAVCAYKEALSARKAFKGETALDEALVFFELAKSFAMKNSFQAAIDCLTETRQILNTLPRENGRVRGLFAEVESLVSSLDKPFEQEGILTSTFGDDIVDDPPLLILPSSGSMMSGIQSDGESFKEDSPVQYREIIVHEDEQAIEIQDMLSLPKPYPEASGSTTSTRSLTPESSLEEVTTPVDQPGDVGPRQQVRETNCLSEDDAVERCRSPVQGEEESIFSIPSVTTAASGPVELCTPGEPSNGSSLKTSTRLLADVAVADQSAVDVDQLCEASKAQSDGDGNNPIDEGDFKFHSIPDSCIDDPNLESEYDSFVEGSIIADVDLEYDLTDYVTSDAEGADLEYTTEDDRSNDDHEDVYWDDEENREVVLSESLEQEVEAGGPFRTPLGLVEVTNPTGINSGRELPEETSRQSPEKPSISSLGTDTKMSPRHRIAKALTKTFRRRRSHNNPLGPTPEEREADIEPDAVQRRLEHDLAQDEEPFSGPIDFVKLRSISFDDTVSQITMQQDDFLSRTESDSQWWWGVTSEGLQGWLPTAFADLAEDFLSAKSIHNKSRNSDQSTYSDSTGYDSDPFDDISEEGQTEETGTETQSVSVSNSGSHVLNGPDADDIVYNVNLNRWNPESVISRSDKEMIGSPQVKVQINAFEKELEQRQSDHGYYHSAVATSLITLALLRAEAGEPNRAVEEILEALRIQKALKDPQAMARSLHVLADVYSRQEDYEKALDCYHDVQHLERRLFGPDHPECAITLNRIGRVFLNQERFYEAMEKHQQALKVLKAGIGEDLKHPAVAQTLISIGEVYYRERNSLDTIRNSADDYKRFIETGMIDVIAQAHENRGSYKKALGFLEEKLQLINKDGTDFPEDRMAGILYSLGTLSCKSGAYFEAIDYYEKALDLQVKLGCTEVEVATAKVLIGTVEYHLGQYRKSLNLLESALEVFQQELGAVHEVVADTLHRIGIVKSTLWHHDDAIENLNSALKLQATLFGDNDLEVLKTTLEILSVEMNRGPPEDVLPRMKEILNKQREIVGVAHPIIADTLSSLGKAYSLHGNDKRAVKLYQESFQMRERFLGRDHPLQAEVYHLIALEAIRKDRFQQGVKMCNSVLNIRKETLGERHLDVACTLCSLGRCYAGSGKFTESQRCLDEALEIAEESVGEIHPCVGGVYVGKGILSLRKCQFQEAKQAIEKAIEIFKAAEVNPDHKFMKEAEELLVRVDRDEMLCV
jgi:tetratricopeptide (TPR) repeat protein